MLINTDKYMFIRFKDGGRGPDYCDCRGLVGYIVKQEYGIELPDAEISCVEISKVDSAIRKNLKDWQKIDNPILTLPCVILMCTVPNRINHMGLYIGNGDFIHISKRIMRPRINSIYDDYWSMVREGFYVPKN